MSTHAPSIYSDLGERTGITRFVSEFTSGLYHDPELGSFFSQMSKERKNVITAQVVSFMVQVTGGAEKYEGKQIIPMLANLGISQRQWGISMGHMLRALEGNNVPEAARMELINYLSALGEEIAESSKASKVAN